MLSATVLADTCTPLMTVLQEQPGHILFARVLEATGFEFDSTLKYTVLLPSDGPANAKESDGTEGFGGFFQAFGYDTSSVESIKGSEDIENLAGVLAHMILPGALSAADLRAAASDTGGANDVRTLYDTKEDAATCEHLNDGMHEAHFGESSGAAQMLTADGDIRVRPFAALRHVLHNLRLGGLLQRRGRMRAWAEPYRV